MQHEWLVRHMDIRRRMWYIDDWGGVHCLNGILESRGRDIDIPTIPCKTACMTVTVEKETENGPVLDGVAKDCADQFFISGQKNIEAFPPNSFYLFRDFVQKEYNGNFTYTYEFLKDNFHNTDIIIENYNGNEIWYPEESKLPQCLAVGFLIIVLVIILSIIGSCFLSRCMTRKLRRELAQLRSASGHLAAEISNQLVLVEQAEDIPLSNMGEYDGNEDDTR
ncbi:hypothetical protein CAEBREN_20208 [Caenorhabditis brenneri]|uniref:Uncharacterized protein n=1 Tax=Caenorhabditis brenneri TaxID=135651 RepID=G0MHY8_CAEBE|nr:hypothetical protein CAEBREN_20208 [Caenorhabditis brenneri]